VIGITSRHQVTGGRPAWTPSRFSRQERWCCAQVQSERAATAASSLFSSYKVSIGKRHGERRLSVDPRTRSPAAEPTSLPARGPAALVPREHQNCSLAPNWIWREVVAVAVITPPVGDTSKVNGESVGAVA